MLPAQFLNVDVNLAIIFRKFGTLQNSDNDILIWCYALFVPVILMKLGITLNLLIIVCCFLAYFKLHFQEILQNFLPNLIS